MIDEELNENTGEETEIPDKTPDTPIEEPKSDIPLVNKFKAKFPLVPISEFEDLYEQAKGYLLQHVFPFDWSVVDIPEEMRPRVEWWIERAMTEILAYNNVADGISLSAYAENGVSMSFNEEILSPFLLNNMPVPFIGVKRVRK